MNESKYITNVTGDSFQTQVVECSHRVPVLVDYWADWCGPCKMQLPVLHELIEQFAGGFLLAKINTDEERALAQEHGIRSLPTMRLYKDGVVVEEILGAQTVATMRSMLERHVARPSDQEVENARAAFRQGRVDAALETLAAARESDPDNPRIPLAYLELCLESNRPDTAQAMLDELPAEIRQTAEAARMQARITFAAVAQTAPAREALEQRVAERPADMEARYQLAARLIIAGELQAGMDQLLAIIQRDRQFRDDAGYKGLLGAFELAEDDTELVSEYRRKLFNSLH